MCDRSSDPTQYDGAAPDDASSRASAGSGAALTPRQREALAAYAETGEYDAAARSIGANLQTYKNTLQVVYRKLGVTGAIDAFRVLGWLSARERPSALDVAVVESVLHASEEEGLDTYATAKLVVARLTEPDAGEGTDPMLGTPADGRHPDHGPCGQTPCPHIPTRGRPGVTLPELVCILIGHKSRGICPRCGRRSR